mgnify:CR=1 FL=1
MPGAFMVANSLGVACLSISMGIPVETVVEGIEAMDRVPGRVENIDTEGRDFSIVLDYCHKPEALKNVLEMLKGYARGRVICVFGCGGNRDCTKRPKMGKIAQSLADKIIVTSDNPRSEDPQQIITDILSGLTLINPKTVFVEPDRRMAIKLLKDISTENDVLVLAGKGHENYQILADKTIHFDDREEALKVFG